MDWIGDHWLDVLGWGGSALLVFSLLQARVLRFRVLNLTACVLLVVFNALRLLGYRDRTAPTLPTAIPAAPVVSPGLSRTSS